MNTSSSKSLVLNAQQMEQKLRRMAWEIYEQNHKEKEIVIAGIFPRGYILSERLTAFIKEISPIEVKLLKINLDKDEPTQHPVVVSEHQSLTKSVVVVVDDVVKSGKTLMYASQYFLNLKIKKLMTAILIDRNYKKYPIKGDVVGLSLSTTLKDHVKVELGKNESVYLD